MTVNAVVSIDNTSWTDLHAGASIASGTALVCQLKSSIITAVLFVDATTEPTGTVDTAGGLETNGAKDVISTAPDAGEVTWARTRVGGINISVQDT
ncbi:MAG: hypothetical protein V3R83_12405 [Gammaproteobacteria bacterium]